MLIRDVLCDAFELLSDMPPDVTVDEVDEFFCDEDWETLGRYFWDQALRTHCPEPPATLDWARCGRLFLAMLLEQLRSGHAERVLTLHDTRN